MSVAVDEPRPDGVVDCPLVDELVPGLVVAPVIEPVDEGVVVELSVDDPMVDVGVDDVPVLDVPVPEDGKLPPDVVGDVVMSVEVELGGGVETVLVVDGGVEVVTGAVDVSFLLQP